MIYKFCKDNGFELYRTAPFLHTESNHYNLQTSHLMDVDEWRKWEDGSRGLWPYVRHDPGPEWKRWEEKDQAEAAAASP